MLFIKKKKRNSSAIHVMWLDGHCSVRTAIEIHQKSSLNSWVAPISAPNSSSLNWQASNKTVFSQYWYFNLFSVAQEGKGEQTLHQAALKAHRRRPGRKKLSAVTAAKEVREWTLQSVFLGSELYFQLKYYSINNMLAGIPAPTVHTSVPS